MNTIDQESETAKFLKQQAERLYLKKAMRLDTHDRMTFGLSAERIKELADTRDGGVSPCWGERK